MLVRPSRPANVAAACRAMKNMGLRTLWLVGAKPELGDEAGRALAYGAWDVLDAARRADSLPEAVSASLAVVGTTALPVAGAWSPRRLAAESEALAGAGTLSLVARQRQKAFPRVVAVDAFRGDHVADLGDGLIHRGLQAKGCAVVVAQFVSKGL